MSRFINYIKLVNNLYSQQIKILLYFVVISDDKFNLSYWTIFVLVHIAITNHDYEIKIDKYLASLNPTGRY